MSRMPIIAVDFDGTIAGEEIFPAIGELLPNCAKTLRMFKEHSFTIILWTCREGKALEAAINFCSDHKIPIDYVNENVGWLPFKTSNKIYADYYIDNRAIGDSTIFWNDIFSKIPKTSLPDFIEI